jgi:hypothetical protein
MLRRTLKIKLCPKARLYNISEFTPMKELFAFGKRLEWSSAQLAGTYLVARGIRGREGVDVLHDFCRKEEPNWGESAYVNHFVDTFEMKWRAEVQRTNTVGALSHQEHYHAGLSGMNFVETLKRANMRVSLLGPCGMASRLAPFFQEPERLDANALLSFYKELVKEPIHMRIDSSSVQNEATRILGKRQKVKEAESNKKHQL